MKMLNFLATCKVILKYKYKNFCHAELLPICDGNEVSFFIRKENKLTGDNLSKVGSFGPY